MKIILSILLVLSSLLAKTQSLQYHKAADLHYIEKPSTDSLAPVLILVHGYGSNEKDLFGLANHFPSKYHIVCPRGILRHPKSGYSWYAISFQKNGNHLRNFNQARSSMRKLLILIESYKQKNRKVILGGFSQGGILSFQIAIDAPHLVDGIMQLSGAPLFDWTEPKSNMMEEYPNLKVFCAHGTNDPMLSINFARKCQLIYQQAGVQLTYKEYDMKHQINQEELEGIIEWLEAFN